MHVWLSRVDKLDYPDRMIIDLDPGPKQTFQTVKTTALELKTFLEDLGLTPFVMTTGSRGVHVVIPLKHQETFDEVRAFARQLVEVFAAKHPDTLTTHKFARLSVAANFFLM